MHGFRQFIDIKWRQARGVAQFATKAKRIIYYREIIAELLSRTLESPFAMLYGRHCRSRCRRYSIRNSHSKYKLGQFMVENFTAPMPGPVTRYCYFLERVYNAGFITFLIFPLRDLSKFYYWLYFCPPESLFGSHVLMLRPGTLYTRCAVVVRKG